MTHTEMPCSEAWLSLGDRNLCIMAAPSPAVYQGSALLNWPVQIQGLCLQQQESQREMEAVASRGVGATLHPTASSSPGCAEEPAYGSASPLGLSLSPQVHTCAGMRGHSPLPRAHGAPLAPHSPSCDVACST